MRGEARPRANQAGPGGQDTPTHDLHLTHLLLPVCSLCAPFSLSFSLVQKLYTTGDKSAESMLSVFRTNSECIAQSRLILDHSTNQYALLLAAKSLKDLLTLFFHTFTGAQTLEIRNYLLNYIANACNNPAVPSFVINALVETTARVAKLGWRQDPTAAAGQMTGASGVSAPGGPRGAQPGSHAAFVDTCGTFFQHSLRHHQMGLLLLGQLVGEMEAACNVESPSDHRKTSRLFRDGALLEIVRTSLNELRGVGNFVRNGDPKEIEGLLLNAMHLFSACLSFDFIGSIVDETASDDSNVTLQVPSSWRSIVEDTSATSPARLFAQIFEEFQSMSGVQAECLNAFTCLASVRRSIFTNEEARITFMKYLMDTQGSLIQKFGMRPTPGAPSSAPYSSSQPLLDDEQNYHEFCRFIARFKYNFTLNDIVRSASFESWLQTLYLFTVQSGFAEWDSRSANSLSYLLGVWSRIAADVSQLKMSDGSSTYQITNAALLNPTAAAAQPLTHSHKVQAMILEVIPKICEIFIGARLDSIRAALSDGVSDSDAEETYNDIFAEPNLSDQLKYLSVLCRFHYVHMKAFIKARFEPLVEQYKALLQSLLGGGAVPGAQLMGMPHSAADTAVQLQVVESQLTMMTYLIGCIVGCEKSLLLLHPLNDPQQYPFANVEKMTTKDRLELLDAELISWVLQLLPIINLRIERSSETASAARQRAMLPTASCLGESRRHVASAILYFFNEFRKKYLNALAHQNFESYSSHARPGILGMYGLAPTPVSTNANEMGEGPTTPDPLPIPTIDMIGHGASANIFSRSAYFLRQPLTPHHFLQLLVKQFLIFLNFISTDFTVVKETLEVFDALSLNYATSQQIANLEEVKAFLQNNQVTTIGSSVTSTSGGATVRAEVKPIALTASSQLLMSDLAFLHSTSHPTLQTTFYQILSRLVFKGSNIDMFPLFITPFTTQLQQLVAIPNLRAMPRQLIDQVILLVHKLHGVVSAINSMVVFTIFYEWFFETNRFASLILRLCETFWDTTEVLHPILDFYAELIWNKSQRIRFDSNSPNGIILFKETYKIVSTYIQRMMMVPTSQDGTTGASATSAGNELYNSRLKGISKVLQLVSHSLNGGYCNFGVMAYYNDATLKQCLTQTMQCAMSVRFAHIINYPRVATNYFNFVEILFKSHMETCVEICDTPKFLALISSLHEGLLSLHHAQIMQAANAIEHLMKWKFELGQPKKAGSSARAALERHLSQSATLLPEILCTLINIVRTRARTRHRTRDSRRSLLLAHFLMLSLCVLLPSSRTCSTASSRAGR